MSVAVFEETLRRHVTSAGYIVFILLMAMVGLFASTFNRPASMWPALVTMLAIITGSALIGSEFSTGTLQLIVTKPIRRSVYLLSRAAGVFTAVCVAAAIGLCTEAVGRLAIGEGVVPWRALADAFGGSLVESSLVIGLLTLLGSITRSYLNVAIYLTTQIGLSIVASILGVVRMRGGAVGGYVERHPGIELGLAFVDDFLFPAATQELHWLWVLRVVATAAVALAAACLFFNRREVPYGAD